MGKMSRDKGKRGEREWANYLRDKLGFDAKRGQQHRGGPDSPDVIGGIPGTHCEVKRTERLNLSEAMTQAVMEAKPGEVPYVAHRRNGKGWMVTVEACDLFCFAKLIASNATKEDQKGSAA